MAMSQTLAWRIYSEKCAMVAYKTDWDHNPPQWQEYLTGAEKQAAIDIINADIAAADEPRKYTEHLINPTEQTYIRTSRASGNSWEVKKLSDGTIAPNPCEPAQPPDPRSRKFSFTDGSGSLTYRGQRATLIMQWTELPPTA